MIRRARRAWGTVLAVLAIGTGTALWLFVDMPRRWVERWVTRLRSRS